VAREMARNSVACFSVRLRFQTSERLGGAYGQAGIGAEIVEQAGGGQAFDVAAIPPAASAARPGRSFTWVMGKRAPGGQRPGG